MKLKFRKIFFLISYLISFGLCEVSIALDFLDGPFKKNNEDIIIVKEGGKTSNSKKSNSKKSGVKNYQSDKKNNNKEQFKENNLKSNKEFFKEAAKERYEIWKKNKKSKQNYKS